MLPPPEEGGAFFAFSKHCLAEPLHLPRIRSDRHAQGSSHHERQAPPPWVYVFAIGEEMLCDALSGTSSHVVASALLVHGDAQDEFAPRF